MYKQLAPEIYDGLNLVVPWSPYYTYCISETFLWWEVP